MTPALSCPQLLPVLLLSMGNGTGSQSWAARPRSGEDFWCAMSLSQTILLGLNSLNSPGRAPQARAPGAPGCRWGVCGLQSVNSPRRPSELWAMITDPQENQPGLPAPSPLLKHSYRAPAHPPSTLALPISDTTTFLDCKTQTDFTHCTQPYK